MSNFAAESPKDGGKTPSCAKKTAAPCARSDCRTSGWILEGEGIQDGRKD